MTTAGIIVVALLLASCADPRRFDPPRQQELQRQQDACMNQYNDPQRCRP